MLSPCNNLCCRCLSTCQSLRFSPADRSPPGSSWSPGRGEQSVEMPSRSSQLRSDWLCAASGTGPAPHWSAEVVRPPGSWHLAHGLWGGSHRVRKYLWSSNNPNSSQCDATWCFWFTAKSHTAEFTCWSPLSPNCVLITVKVSWTSGFQTVWSQTLNWHKLDDRSPSGKMFGFSVDVAKRVFENHEQHSCTSVFVTHGLIID